jgi:hypothetical protein
VAEFHSSWKEGLYDYLESNNAKSDGVDFRNQNGIKHIYCDGTWKQEHFIYDPKPQEFVGVSKPNVVWNQFPIMMLLFHLF